MTGPRTHSFRQVDVFGDGAFSGNALAVVHDATGWSDGDMAAFARWTNLAETTFLLPPTAADADYRLRIFTPDRELPFAGHPTLGSAHAWSEAGGRATGEPVVQECGAGLVRLRPEPGGWAFAAPPLQRSGPVDTDDAAAVCSALGLDPATVTARWVDNGPGWMGLLLPDAASVLRLAPRHLAGFPSVGVAGPQPEGADTDLEVRAFVAQAGGVTEDPVTGSLNAGLGQWLTSAGLLPSAYLAAQGTCLRRRGRVRVAREAADVWVAGSTTTRILGSLRTP